MFHPFRTRYSCISVARRSTSKLNHEVNINIMHCRECRTVCSIFLKKKKLFSYSLALLDVRGITG